MKSWVVAWVTPSDHPPVSIDQDDACWLMVRHTKRGWELPGGWVELQEEGDHRISNVECLQQLIHH